MVKCNVSPRSLSATGLIAEVYRHLAPAFLSRPPVRPDLPVMAGRLGADPVWLLGLAGSIR